MTQDKQLRGVSLETVVEKRRLDQALNAKEFAVLAGLQGVAPISGGLRIVAS